jgi:hypothetical protein
VGVGFRVLRGGESWGALHGEGLEIQANQTTYGNEDQVRRSSEQQCCQQFWTQQQGWLDRSPEQPYIKYKNHTCFCPLKMSNFTE